MDTKKYKKLRKMGYSPFDAIIEAARKVKATKTTMVNHLLAQKAFF